MKLYILDAAHKSIPCINFIAINDPKLIFYVHIDKKFTLDVFSKNIKNLIYIDHRMDVKWGGFSQVQATLNLFEAALLDSKAEYFHFISGEDVILYKNQLLIENLCWDHDQIFIQMNLSKSHRYRVRFCAPHVETKWQRKVLGKAFTFILRILDKILPTNKKIWFGSSWFSIRRREIEKIIENISYDDIAYFKRRLNPDEHFFQYMIYKTNLLSKVSVDGNKRYIVFDKNYNNGNNPIYQSFDNLINVSREAKYFFARKVDLENQALFYKKVND